MAGSTRRKGMGSHESTKMQDEAWLTPPGILRALGQFDLDPCAAPEPRPWATATHHIALPENGLAAEWKGRVFLNPPYGLKIGAWLKKMALHRDGITLIYARTDTRAWHNWIWPFASALLFFDGRIFFHLPDGTRKASSPGAPSVLIAYNRPEAERLANCGIRGAVVQVVHCSTAPQPYLQGAIRYV